MTTINDPLIEHPMDEKVKNLLETSKPPKKGCYLTRISQTYDKTFTFNYTAISINAGIIATFISVCLQ